MPRLRALTTIAYPTDPSVIARLLAGENLRWDQRSLKEVAPGEYCDDLPECSREGFIAKGKVELVPDPAKSELVAVFQAVDQLSPPLKKIAAELDRAERREEVTDGL